MLLMTSLLFPVSLPGEQLWPVFPGQETRCGWSIGTGHTELSPLILSDFQTSEKGKTNPLSTAIISKLFFCNFFGGDSENKNLSSFDEPSYQSLSPVTERKRDGVFTTVI